jgi:hypothetical protein
MEVTCASGLTFEARKFNLDDIDETLGALKAELGDKGHRKANLPLSGKMLQVVAGPVINPGPYAFEVGQPPRFEEVAFSDVAVANLIVRKATRPELLVSAPCPACQDMGPDGVRSIDLECVESFVMSREGIECIRTGVPILRQFESTDEPGLALEIKIKPLLTKSINKMALLQTQDEKRALSIQTCFFISGLKELSQPGAAELTTLSEIRARYGTLPWDVMEFIDAEIEDHFGGFDETFTFRCEKMLCNTAGEGKIRMDPTFYGLGGRRRRQRRLRR